MNGQESARLLPLFLAVIDAWTRRDTQAVLAALTEDVVWHYAAGAAPPARGQAEARAFLERFGRNIAAVRWRLFHHAEGGDRLFVEGVDEFDTTDGRTVIAPYAGVIEFRGVLICGWRDYVDSAVMAAMKTGAAPADHVRELVHRPALSA